MDADRRAAAVAGDLARRERAAVVALDRHGVVAAGPAHDLDVDRDPGRRARLPAVDGRCTARAGTGAAGRRGGLLARSVPAPCRHAGRERGQDAHGDGARVTGHGALLSAHSSCPVPEGSGITTPREIPGVPRMSRFAYLIASMHNFSLGVEGQARTAI